MFVQNWGNKLDRDLANQNSLQKLSDPGGSRALDKQDWLFQRHAYITPIWARAITHRQLRENKPDSYRNCFADKHGKISGLFFDKWRGIKRHLLQNAQALLCDKHDVKCLESCSDNMRDRTVCQRPKKKKKKLSCSLFIINIANNSWQENTERIKNRLEISQPTSSPSFNMTSEFRRGEEKKKKHL